MIRLYIKQRVFSFKDQFVVKDEAGNDKYLVEGELLSFGHTLHIKDMHGIEVGMVRQKLLTFLPKFEITIQGKVVGELAKQLRFFRPAYEIQGGKLSLEGDFIGHQYVLKREDQTVMRIYKEWFTWGDSYVLDIVQPKDELLSLAVVLAIDCEMCSDQNN